MELNPVCLASWNLLALKTMAPFAPTSFRDPDQLLSDSGKKGNPFFGEDEILVGQPPNKQGENGYHWTAEPR